MNPQHCSIHRSFPHPNRTDLGAEDLRFILTLRAVGEGHISSLEFRSGVIRRSHSIEMDETSSLVTAPDIDSDPVFPKNIFLQKLREKGLENDWSRSVMNKLGVAFTRTELDESLQRAAHQTQLHTDDVKRAIECVHWLVESNYDVASAAQFRSPNASSSHCRSTRAMAWRTPVLSMKITARRQRYPPRRRRGSHARHPPRAPSSPSFRSPSRRRH